MSVADAGGGDEETRGDGHSTHGKCYGKCDKYTRQRVDDETGELQGLTNLTLNCCMDTVTNL